jgi:hypothetical protein
VRKKRPDDGLGSFSIAVDRPLNVSEAMSRHHISVPLPLVPLTDPSEVR